MAMEQTAMQDIATQVDGDFTDLQLVENIQTASQEKKQWAAKLKRFQEALAQRLKERGITELQVGEDIVTIGPKMLSTYDQVTLGSLKQCVDDDKLWLVIKGIPSGKQLKELSQISGAAAKAVIESAKRKLETDTIVVKIKKPRKPRGRKRF